MSEKKEKTAFLSVALTRCPECRSSEVTVKHHASKRLGTYYYDYCACCGHIWNRKTLA
jgi:hypothetical protein